MQTYLYRMVVLQLLLSSAIVFGLPNTPTFHSSQNTPNDLFPTSVGYGPYQVVIDYTYPGSRKKIKHTYLQIKGAGVSQTMQYFNLSSVNQLSGEGDHLENMSVSKVNIANGYRITYTFDIKGSWPSAADVDIDAWSISKSSQQSPVLSHSWNRTFDNGLVISDAGLDLMVDNDGDGWYSSLKVAVEPNTGLPVRTVDLDLYSRSGSIATGGGDYIASVDNFVLYGSAVGWAGPIVTTQTRDAYDFSWQLFHNSLLCDEMLFGADPDISNVRMEPATDDAYREISFGGIDWVVRAAKVQGPGPNDWLNNSDAVWVDSEGLHLTIDKDSAGWYCTEVITKNTMGYGTYTFKLDGRIDLLDPNVVLGLFVYENDTQEADFEFTRWGDPLADNAQFVVQPYDTPGNLDRFNIVQAGDYTMHVMVWEANQITFKSYHGHQINSNNLINEWVYQGSDVPTADNEKLHMNLWLNDTAPADGQPVEFIIKDFTYQP